MRLDSSNQKDINSGKLAGIYEAGLKRHGVIKKKGGIKLNGLFASPEIKEIPVLTIQNASGRNVFTIVKDA